MVFQLSSKQWGLFDNSANATDFTIVTTPLTFNMIFTALASDTAVASTAHIGISAVNSNQVQLRARRYNTQDNTLTFARYFLVCL